MTDPADCKPAPQPPEWEHVTPDLPSRRHEYEVTEEERMARRHLARAEQLWGLAHPADISKDQGCGQVCHVAAHHRQMATVYALLAAL